MALYISIALFLMFGLIVELKSSRKETVCTLKNSFLKSRNSHTRGQLLFFVIVIFILWFLTAFRSEEMGNDTVTYINYFQYFGKVGMEERNKNIEIGYQFLNVIIHKISPNPHFFLAVVATICYLGVGIYIYKYSSNVVFSTVILFPIVYGFFASGLRQSIALVICLFAYQAIKNKKIIPAILIVLLASTFHLSALVMLILLIHKFTSKRLYVVIGVSAIIAILSASGALNSIISNVVKEYENYFSSIQAGTGWLAISYQCIRALMIYLFIYFAYKDLKKEKSLEIFNASILLITICFGFSTNIFSRASLYFLIPSVVDIPNAMNSGNIKNKKFFIFLICTVMIAYFVLTLFVRPEWYKMIPYEFFWN